MFQRWQIALPLALIACQPQAQVELHCPTEPGTRVQLEVPRRVAYTIEGDCPEPGDCKPGSEYWSYSPSAEGGDVRFYEGGWLHDAVSIGFGFWDSYCCPDQGAWLVGLTPGTVTLTVSVSMAVDGHFDDYVDSCELPVVVWDLVRVD